MSSNTKHLFIFVALTFVVAIGVGFLLTSRTKADNPSVTVDAVSLESKHVKEAEAISADDEPQVVSLEVTPAGFQPSEVIATRGKFLILLQNRTGRRDLNFWLARENRQRLAESAPQNVIGKPGSNLIPAHTSLAKQIIRSGSSLCE